VLLLAGCTDVSGTEGKGYISGDGQVTVVDPAAREEPVEMTGEDLTGEPVSLADLRGRPVVVNVWWSLCPPCRTEMPDLVEASEELDGEAYFLGINVRDNAVEQARLFEERFDVPYPSVYDPTGQALLAFSGLLSPRTIPSTVVLDDRGRVAASVVGPLPSKQTLLDLVTEASGDGGPA
jgi:thiol-disulfide isomerase/thioredoxin